MQRGVMLVIEGVCNGFIVRPFAPEQRMVAVTETMVFNLRGHSMDVPGMPQSLLGFIAEHFDERDDDA